jgi:hypothetical protein
VKSAGKPSAGNRHAGFDVAGAGNVITGAGLRPMLKGMELCHRTLPSARQSSTLLEVEARNGDIPVDYNKYSDRSIRGPVAINRITLGRGELIRITVANVRPAQ